MGWRSGFCQNPASLDYMGALRSYSALIRMVSRAIFPLSPTLARVVFELFAGQLHLFDCLLSTKTLGVG